MFSVKYFSCVLLAVILAMLWGSIDGRLHISKEFRDSFPPDSNNHWNIPQKKEGSSTIDDDRHKHLNLNEIPSDEDKKEIIPDLRDRTVLDSISNVCPEGFRKVKKSCFQLLG